MANIRFERVSKRFGNQQAGAMLDLNLDVGQGAADLVAPPCGQSTTLNMLAVETPPRGDLYHTGW